MKKQTKGGFLIAKIHHLSGRIFTKMLQKHQIEINPAQGRIMFVLWQKDGITINELAKQTSLAKSTLTSMLDRLVETGLVTRVPSDEDRRKILIKRTEKDRARQKAYAKVSKEMDKKFYNGFSAEEVENFEGFLNRILDNLTITKDE